MPPLIPASQVGLKRVYSDDESGLLNIRSRDTHFSHDTQNFQMLDSLDPFGILFLWILFKHFRFPWAFCIMHLLHSAESLGKLMALQNIWNEICNGSVWMLKITILGSPDMPEYEFLVSLQVIADSVIV